MQTIAEIKSLLLSRFNVLERLVDAGAAHFAGNEQALLSAKLADDMWDFGSQITAACTPAQGFAQWSAGEPIVNWPRGVESLAQAKEIISATKALIEGITAGEDILTTDKRIGMGPTRHAMLPGADYVRDYVIPNVYFHMAAAYMILRNQGVSLSKNDWLAYLGPYVRPNVAAE